MKALSLTQPWASLVSVGAKRIETRSWPTSYRGAIAIHASKVFPGDCRALCFEQPFFSPLHRAHLAKIPVPGLPGVERLPRGAIIAVATLVECLPITANPIPQQRTLALDEDGVVRDWRPHDGTPSIPLTHVGIGEDFGEHEATFGNYSPGRFGFLLANVRRLPESILCRGALGLWEVPAEIAVQLGRMEVRR